MGESGHTISTDAMNSQPRESGVSHTWGVAFRPTLLFVAAYALNVTPHEIIHALTSYSLGFNSTVFEMWVNPASTEASSNELAIIAVSGPLFSLTVGVVCWLLYKRRFRERPSGLAFLTMAMVGIYSFLGPLAGTALGGDFHIAFTFLDISRTVSYLASAMDSYCSHGSCITSEENWLGGPHLSSVALRLLLVQLWHLGCLELFYSYRFIGRCRDS